MAKAAAEPTEEAPEDKPKRKRGKKAVLIPFIVLSLGVGGGGYMFMSGGKQANANAKPTTTTTTLGTVVRLDDITLNLSDSHILKVGLALQLVDKPKNKELAAALAANASSEGSSSGSSTSSPLGGLEAKALDIAIANLGNMTFAQLSEPGGRTAAKDALSKQIQKAYDGDVVSVYFTDFVMS